MVTQENTNAQTKTLKQNTQNNLNPHLMEYLFLFLVCKTRKSCSSVSAT